MEITNNVTKHKFYLKKLFINCYENILDISFFYTISFIKKMRLMRYIQVLSEHVKFEFVETIKNMVFFQRTNNMKLRCFTVTA